VRISNGLRSGSLAFTVWLAFAVSACQKSGDSRRALLPAEQPPGAAAVVELREDLTDAGSIAKGQRRIYRASLVAGQFLEIEAEQRGVDFKLIVTGPGGLQLTADSPNGRHGPERLLLWATAAGDYEVALVATDAEADPRFTLRVMALHAGSEHERRRAQAFGLGMDADRQRRSGDVGEMTRAILTYKQEAAAWHALGELRGEIHALDGLVLVARRLHDRREQIEASRQLTVLYERAGDAARQAESLVDLGEALLELDRRRPAQEAFREALRLVARAPDEETEARAWNALANACQREGQLDQAREGFERSLVLWRRLGRSQSEAITRANLAFLLAELGEPQLALDELERARGSLPVPPSPDDEAFLLTREVDTLIRLNRQDDSVRQMAERAVALRRESADPRALANALSTAALFEYQEENFSQAEKLFLEARHAMLQAGDSSGAAQNLVSAGWCRVRAGTWAAAGVAFAQALPVLEAAGHPQEAAAALAGLAWVERQRGDLQRARQHALAAVSLIEALRSSTDRLDFRASLLADRQQFFDLAVDVLMLLQARTGNARYAAEAFAVSERAHGRFLLEALPGDEARAAEPRPPEALALRADRVDRLDAACRSARASGAPETTLRTCDIELRSALNQLRDSDAATAAGSVTRPVSLAEAQRELLADGSQLLLYDLGRTRSYLWVVSSRDVRTFVLPKAAELERRALDVYRALAGSQRRAAWFEAERRSAALAAELLEPALPLLTGRRLLIVREGALLYVPFSALPLPASGAAHRQSLLARHEVSYLPSASVGVWMRRLRKRMRPADFDVVALGHPLPTPGFRPLPFSATEARAVVAAAPLSRGKAFLEDEAVKEVLTHDRLGRPRFLHLAAHGFADDRYPELSGLVFAARDEQGRARDGVLRAYEVARLRLQSELVVLSACDSGLGAEIPGEGLVGLPHAFLRAGAGKVLASLWRVNDPSAPALMGELYQGLLQDGLTPEAALQRAQLKVAAHPKWRQPYYWAGFVLFGAG
jgi:CHAT domain-containing protein/tetratricopeptide (TPR) repeat protein